MEASLIPIIAIFLLILVSGPDQSALNKNRTDLDENFAKTHQVYYEASDEDTAADYKTIYNYIRNNFRKVPEEDAKAIAGHLVESSKKHNVDPKFAAAVMARESGFNKEAVSRSGAKGLGQIKDFNYSHLKINDPFNIKENSSGTVKYLKSMLDKWKNKTDKTSLALASYYKGYGAVSRENGEINGSTKRYVDDILKNYDKLKNLKIEYMDSRVDEGL